MIILYGNPDPMAAFRAALIWKSMGVKDVRVLNGGIRAWLSKSLPIEVSQGGSTTISLSKKRGSSTKDASPEETKRRQGEEELLIRQYVDQSLYAQNPINYLVDQNYVLDLVKNYDLFADQYALVDVRSYDEHVGRLSGYEQLPTRGRIPTSLWGRGGSSRDQLEDYRLEYQLYTLYLAIVSFFSIFRSSFFYRPQINDCYLQRLRDVDYYFKFIGKYFGQ